MNHTTLIFAVFSVLVGILLFGIWSNTHVFAQQLPSSSPRPAAGSSSSLSTTTTISPVFMTLVSSPAINLLSNNYLLYHYQAFADKGRADVTNNDNSDKDATTTTITCPDGSELTDSGKCKTIQDNHPENPITTITNDDEKANDKPAHKSHSHSDPLSSPFDN